MAKLTSAARKKLAPTQFALPGGKYPINDASHARNALSRASANATPAQQATIKNKVKTKYPGIAVGGTGLMGKAMPKRGQRTAKAKAKGWM